MWIEKFSLCISGFLRVDQIVGLSITNFLELNEQSGSFWGSFFGILFILGTPNISSERTNEPLQLSIENTPKPITC
jgi:hypothetical protein